MKTSVEISNALFAQAQRVLKAENTTLRNLIEEGLRKVLEDRKTKRALFKLGDASVGGNGLSREFQNASWDVIRDAAYGYDRD
jgi:hypothetical protein